MADPATRLSRREFLKVSTVLAMGAQLPALVSACSMPPTVVAERKRIYIAPDEHTDYFWSADEATYRQAFLNMLDWYLDLADATEEEPPEHQSRWACDGSLWLWTYEKHKTQPEFERLIARIRDGHISVPLNALCVCLGGAPMEAVLRGMYYPGQIERRYDLRFRLVYMIENQTMPYGIVSLWAGSGARYSWKGVCRCDSLAGAHPAEFEERDHEIYWWLGPDGGRLLTKWYSFVGHYDIGGYAEAWDPAKAVDFLDADPDFLAQYPYHISAAFGHGGDNIESYTKQFVDVAKSKTNARRLVTVSNEQDFFEDFEAHYGADLPSISCSFGNEWDLFCAELAEVSARVKRAVEKLRTAEALATLVTQHHPDFMKPYQSTRDVAWMNLGLYWEHDFGMVSPPTGEAGIEKRIAWQRRLASEIEHYVDTLHADAAAALARLIEDDGSGLRFYVFNPLGWIRSDIADLPYTGPAEVHVIDLSTGQEVPSQIVTLGKQTCLRLWAADIPSVGYKVYEIRAGRGLRFSGMPAANAATGVMGNEDYTVTVASRGAITSLKSKRQKGREFVRSIAGRDMNDLGPGVGQLHVENAGPVSVTLVATSSEPLAHTTRITLRRGSDRIDIQNEITQGFHDTLTWDFCLDLMNPEVWHEEVGAIIQAKLTTEGGHYSPRAARYDWLTLNHFVDMNDGAVGLTLSNADCYFMRLGNSGQNGEPFLDTQTPRISVLVGGREGGEKRPNTGIAHQGGDTFFKQRFSLRTHSAYDPVSSMKFALEHQNPLVATTITVGSGFPGERYSFLTLSNPNVLLWALKPADDGPKQGLTARLWNLASQTTDVSLSLADKRITSAQRLTHIETPLEAASIVDGQLVERLAPHQVRTFSLLI